MLRMTQSGVNLRVVCDRLLDSFLAGKSHGLAPPWYVIHCGMRSMPYIAFRAGEPNAIFPRD